MSSSGPPRKLELTELPPTTRWFNRGHQCIPASAACPPISFLPLAVPVSPLPCGCMRWPGRHTPLCVANQIKPRLARCRSPLAPLAPLALRLALALALAAMAGVQGRGHHRTNGHEFWRHRCCSEETGHPPIQGSLPRSLNPNLAPARCCFEETGPHDASESGQLSPSVRRGHVVTHGDAPTCA
jgi:hypothetical protein